MLHSSCMAFAVMKASATSWCTLSSMSLTRSSTAKAFSSIPLVSTCASSGTVLLALALQNSSSHSSSEESRFPGPLHTLQCGCRLFFMRCFRTFVRSNLQRPWHSVHGQCTLDACRRRALSTSQVHILSSRRRCCLCTSDRGFLASSISIVRYRISCCTFDARCADM